jgi:hypothetical protein
LLLIEEILKVLLFPQLLGNICTCHISRNRKWHFKSNSKGERDEWMEAIEKLHGRITIGQEADDIPSNDSNYAVPLDDL